MEMVNEFQNYFRNEKYNQRVSACGIHDETMAA
jgi:hypothetical protein